MLRSFREFAAKKLAVALAVDADIVKMSMNTWIVRSDLNDSNLPF